MLVDQYLPKFEYLRLSITDACNFKCQYCLPNGYKPTSGEKLLTLNEIHRLVQAFAELGIWKIRITGGEPTLRRDFDKIIETISSISLIKKIALSTNGFRLEKDAEKYFQLGIKNINVSVDSLNSTEFFNITQTHLLKNILNGIEKCLKLNFDNIKINAVLLKNLNYKSINLFLDYIKTRNVSVRFIELMRTNENDTFFNYEHINSKSIIQFIEEIGFKAQEREQGSGPAIVYRHNEYKGSIGIISPYANSFCNTCNRLRVNSTGKIRLCLFGKGHHNLRNYLQDDLQKNELKDAILNSLKLKTASHRLQENNSGDTPHLASIGG